MHILRRARRLIVLTLALALCAPALAEDVIVFDDSAFEFTLEGHEGYAGPAAEPQPTPFVTLQRGSKGDAVRQLQTRLTELGYYGGKISGDF